MLVSSLLRTTPSNTYELIVPYGFKRETGVAAVHQLNADYRLVELHLALPRRVFRFSAERR
jgi:hypothetical protein